MSKLTGHDLGAFLRQQRQSAQLSLRQLSDLAGISNPYLSQIERGLKRPSAEILQSLARGLQVSAETLYVHAGILERTPASPDGRGVLEAIAADTQLTERQRAVLVDVYESFVGESDGHPTVGIPDRQIIGPTEPAAARAKAPGRKAIAHQDDRKTARTVAPRRTTPKQPQK